MAPFSKKDKVLIETLYEQKKRKAYDRVSIKGWIKSSGNRLLKLRTYGTVDRCPCSGRQCIAHIDEHVDVVESLHSAESRRQSKITSTDKRRIKQEHNFRKCSVGLQQN